MFHVKRYVSHTSGYVSGVCGVSHYEHTHQMLRRSGRGCVSRETFLGETPDGNQKEVVSGL